MKSADQVKEKDMKIHVPRTLVVIVVMASLSVAQQQQTVSRAVPTNSKTQSSHTLVAPESIKWNALSAGQWGALMSGSPDTEGAPYVIRLKLADGAKIAPHWHPGDEHVTVVAGTLYVGMGEKFDESMTKGMPSGSYLLMPREMRHFAWAKGETIIQVHGIGPFKTYLVEPVEEQNKK
jgi:quercetin dioxygenase-like cupin family protein